MLRLCSSERLPHLQNYVDHYEKLSAIGLQLLPLLATNLSTEPAFILESHPKDIRFLKQELGHLSSAQTQAIAADIRAQQALLEKKFTRDSRYGFFLNGSEPAFADWSNFIENRVTCLKDFFMAHDFGLGLQWVQQLQSSVVFYYLYLHKVEPQPLMHPIPLEHVLLDASGNFLGFRYAPEIGYGDPLFQIAGMATEACCHSGGNHLLSSLIRLNADKYREERFLVYMTLLALEGLTQKFTFGVRGDYRRRYREFDAARTGLEKLFRRLNLLQDKTRNSVVNY